LGNGKIKGRERSKKALQGKHTTSFNFTIMELEGQIGRKEEPE